MTYLNVWRAWNEADRSKRWCGAHFLNYRNLLRAADIRRQLEFALRCASGADAPGFDRMVRYPHCARCGPAIPLRYRTHAPACQCCCGSACRGWKATVSPGSALLNLSGESCGLSAY